MRLAILIDSIIGIISKPQSMVIVASLFLHTEEFSLSKGLDGHLSHVIVKEVVVDSFGCLGLEVEDLDFGVGDVENDQFLVTDNSEVVDDVLVVLLPEDLTTRVKMDDALSLSRLVNSGDGGTAVVGSRAAEYFVHGWV